MRLIMVLTFLLMNMVTATSPRANVVFVLTDDQDSTLASMDVMNATRALIGSQGVTFRNNFVNTPICCPSRAEIQTGRHMHNTEVYGNTCGGEAFKEGKEKLNVAHYAKLHGNYSCFYAGKYLNNYGSKTTGGVEYIPEGWEEWYGLVGNSKYYGYKVSNNGVMEEHGHDYYTDYFTDYIANKSVAFIQGRAGATNPFFVMLGTPSCHIPDDYAPWTENMFNGSQALRTPNWNVAPNPDKHPMMRGVLPMHPGDPVVDGMEAMYASDWVAIKRWRTLQSVDVMVERLVKAVQGIRAANNTFFLFSSDNGYHLGQFGLGYDKRQLYEEDIRVPLLVKGPGIPRGEVSLIPTMHIDLAPTILDMMGIATPPQMDGRSWLGAISGGGASWRSEMLVEYNGPSFYPGDVRASALDQAEVDVVDGEVVDMFGEVVTIPGGHCKWFSNASTSACDPATNTYACVRSINSSRLPAERNSIYCEFTNVPSADQPWTPFYAEYYDLDADPFQLHNRAQNATLLADKSFQQKMAALAGRLRAHMACSGANCFDPPPAPAPRPPSGFQYQARASGSYGCLSLAEGIAGGAGSGVGVGVDLRLSACGPNASFWREDSDDKGQPEVSTRARGGNVLCLNVLDRHCGAGAKVHAGPCQNYTSKVRLANHFAWNASASMLQSLYCADMCVDVTQGGRGVQGMGGAGQIVLARCADETTVWTRQHRI